jgi:hypothetical protein
MTWLVRLIARIVLAGGGLTAVSCGFMALWISFSQTVGGGERVAAAGFGITLLAMGGLAIFGCVWWSGWEE